MAPSPPLDPPARRCRPPLWARGGHAQTILAHLLPGPRPLGGGAVEQLALPDGDRLAFAVHPGESGVVAHLWHGLAGSSEADYVVGAARALRAAGHGVIAANHRGCGAGRGLARGTYHSGRTEDLAAVLAHGRRRFPDAVHVGVGFSLSGNTFLLLCGQGGAELPDAVLAVNPPLDLERCVERLARGANRLYDLRFALRLRRLVRERVDDGLLDEAPRLPARGGVRGFDERFTAPRSGFADAADYYRRCSAGPSLGAVAVPAAILTAADDPFVHPDDLRGLPRSPAVRLHVEPRGGHLGYLDRGRTLLGGRRWLDAAVLHYVEGLAGLVRGGKPHPPGAPGRSTVAW